jgi:NAD(P)-dependent dehydrogenase (short-subunit alcohol dehydrogenase family)
VRLTRNGYGPTHAGTRRAELALARQQALDGDEAALLKLDSLAALAVSEDVLSSKLVGRSKPKGLYAIKADGSSMNRAEVNGKRIEDGDFIVVNSAGIYGPKGLIEDNDWAAWTQAVEIDLYGAVLLCRAIVPHLKQRGYGKIIQLSGGGATAPLARLSAYAAAKAAVVRFAETLAVELAPHAVDVNCIAPGALNTRMLEEIIAAGPEAVGEALYQRSVEQKQKGGVPLERGAALAVFLATRASDGITGKLLSAVWDPWQDLPGHRDELATSDIYTLRRIVPADRGKPWGGS